MTYEIHYGTVCTRIDQFRADGRWAATVYIHRAEYRHWDA
jgi:hypothetical protein